MRSTLVTAIHAELDRRQANARPRWPTDEVTAVFAALRGVVAAHERSHLCAPHEEPFAVRQYGPGLPYGIDCPGLAAIAAELGVDSPAAAGTSSG
jgi:hypothetical protein